MDIPPETEAWFDRLGELLASSTQRAQQEDHQLATACFGLLFELIGAMESGEEIVFADEIGSGAAIAVRSGCHPRDDIVQVDQPSRAHRHCQ
ncbi:MAG TPA: hypothetical protein VFL17_11900 [Anaerolineae bacterium]|nr:hypothetical protein [Anaerolineae bacterium]